MRASLFTVPAVAAAANLTVVVPPAVNLPQLVVQSRSGFSGDIGGFTDINTFTAASPDYAGTTATSPAWTGAQPVTSYTGTILRLGVTVISPVSVPITLAARFVDGVVPFGSTIITVDAPAGTVLTAGQTVTHIWFPNGTTIESVAQIGPNRYTIELSNPTMGDITNGETVVRTAVQGIQIYPLDQYVAPVEVSIQAINDGSNVTVQATAVPYSELESPDIWGPYPDDAGALTLGTAGSTNTYGNKIATAIRFVNSGPAVRVALAQAGIIS